ncbi:hypothetical protein AB0I10_34545 [Streptomyces sp. NPDC050636]|uniref:hypothetical protein n=1 Tax=Streptomyces sp. NPDC050636 TaxID=3154510 RepID=UPI003429FBBC
MFGKASTVRAARATWARRGAAAVVAAGLAGALLAAGTPAGYAHVPVRASVPSAVQAGHLLKCALRTAPNDPVAFSPAVSGTPRRISARGTVHLDNCASSNGRWSRIASGRLVLRGSGLANCSQVKGVKGSGTITWYSGTNRTGGVVGRSTVVPAGHGHRGYTPVDSFLSGSIASGPMAGRSVMGNAVPTNNVWSCFTGGLGHITGRGKLTVG